MSRSESAILLLLVPVALANSYFTASCPCIDPWDDLNSIPYYNAIDHCLQADTGECLPITFGASQCSTHNNHLDECSNSVSSSIPSICSEEWCYVDPNNCSISRHEPSLPFLTSQNDTDLYVSYHTCGFLGTYNEDEFYSTLMDQTIRVSYPHAENDDGFTLRTDPVTGAKVGSFVSFMDIIFDNYKMNIDIIPISNSSLEQYPSSSWSACVHDVALNRTDLCIGDFWELPERVLKTDFTVNLYQDLFYLVTPVLTDTDVLRIIFSPFRPFTPLVWGFVIISVVLFVILYYFALIHYNPKHPSYVKSTGLAALMDAFNAGQSVI